jgi:hypothetical protein
MNMEMLLKKIEKNTGLSRRSGKKLPFVERVQKCRQYLLELNESRFQIKGDDSFSFEERLERVIFAALETAERMTGISGEGDPFSRLYRLRQFYWDRIFLPKVDNFDSMTRVKRSVMDLQAGEAWYIGRYLELVDFCWHFRIPLPTEETHFDKKIEYVQNLWDFANRTMGGAFSNRINIIPRKVIVLAAPVINLSDRLESYHKDKKATFEQTMSDLEKTYQDCIDEMNRGQ